MAGAPFPAVCQSTTASGFGAPGFEQFIETMCRRVAEGRELLPYAEGTVLLDDVQLAISLPDGLAQRITAHIKEFSA